MVDEIEPFLYVDKFSETSERTVCNAFEKCLRAITHNMLSCDFKILRVKDEKKQINTRFATSFLSPFKLSFCVSCRHSRRRSHVSVGSR